MGRNREAALVEGHKRHDVAIGWHRHLLMIGHEPLRHVGSPTEEATLDEALHARMGDVGAIPRLHGKQRRRNESFAGDERTRARNPGAGGGEAEKARLWSDVSGTKGKAPIYRRRWSER